MPDADYFAPGLWNAICDRCGRKFKSSRLRATWDGLMVCERDWEPRHPQDFVRAVRDFIAPPWTRPDTPGLGVIACTAQGQTAIADSAVCDCAITEYIADSYDPQLTELALGPLNLTM